MSRTGKKAILIPDQVELVVNNALLSVTGKHGVLTYKLHDCLEINFLDENFVKIESLDKKNCCITNNEAKYLRLQPIIKSKLGQEQFGLSRTLIQNMITGVSQKFIKRLEMVGVGYKAQINNKILILNVGFSHPVEMNIPAELSVNIEKNVNIIVEGINKEQVGLFSAKIRNLRPPEPYKGKGIKYVDEHIIRKAGKSAK